MKILITVVAGALMGVSAGAGKPEPVREGAFHLMTGANSLKTESPNLIAIDEAVEALRSGDATYTSVAGHSRYDYVPPRPPL